MKIAFSWDDGALEDQKLFELHEKYEIPGMFFVPTRNREGRSVLSSKMIYNAESKFVSFGGHTENHRYLTSIPILSVENEILQNKYYLENILGHEISDFCLPGGQYNKEILDIVYRHFKTVRTADTMNFKYKCGPLKPAFQFYDRGYKSLLGNMARNKSFETLIPIITHPTTDYFELMMKIIDKESQYDDSIVMIWGHSWEIEEFNLWNKLENLFLFCKNNYPYKIVKYEDEFC